MSVATDPIEATRPGLVTYLGYLCGVAGMAAGLTLLFFGMRAVMDVGGSCATGGPYVPAVECPSGVAEVTLLGFFGGGLATVVTGWYGATIGGIYSVVAFLGWPALFLSLGWNFLEYGLDPPGEGGWEWGWLICAVVFIAMGGLPLAAGIAWRDDVREGIVAAQLETSGRPRVRRIAPVRTGAFYPDDVNPEELLRESAGPGLVDELERLAALRNSGDLTAIEYADAKRALLGEAPRPSSEVSADRASSEPPA